jgi:MFS family permease
VNEVKNTGLPSGRAGLYHGYWIVVAAFTCLFIVSGLGYYAFGLFVIPIQSDMGWGRADIMAAFTIFFLVQGLASPLIGWALYIIEPRKIIAAGALAATLGFILLSQMEDHRSFYLSYALVGVGMAAVGHVPVSTVVSNWFMKRRGTAIGVASTGVGAGGLVLAPLIGGYIIPTFDWRVCYLIMGILTAIVTVPTTLFVLRTKPADMGLRPYGSNKSETVPLIIDSTASDSGLSLKMALRTPALWLAMVAYFFGGFSGTGVLQNQVAYLGDVGFSITIAAGALGGIGFGSLVGKFTFGWLCDRIAARHAFVVALVLQIIGITILMNIDASSHHAILWLYAGIMGLGLGGWLPTMSMVVSENFGLVAYGAIFGVVNLAQSVGVAAGPLLGGYVYDFVGTYHWAFVIYLGLFVISIPSLLLMRHPEDFTI